MIIDSEVQNIVKCFFEAKIIQISTQSTFKLTSGTNAPVYLDHRKIFSHNNLRKSLILKWAELLKNEVLDNLKPSQIVFAGTSTAGIAPAYALAEYFQSGFVYVRSKPKEHGLNSVIEGFIPSQAHIIVVDDMVTTGGSLLQACESIRSAGHQVLAATSISRHDLRKTNQAFLEKNVLLKSLFKTTDLFDIAYASSFVTGREMRVIMEWITQLDEK